MIRINKNSVADTRTCDYTKVTKEELLEASKSHIQDVDKGIDYFINILNYIRHHHDITKKNNIDEFYADFQTGFKTTSWYEMHQETERHHLSDDKYVQDDVNLLDILEMITDGVMAGMARSGEYRKEEIPDSLLRKAYENTIKMLLDRVEVI